MSDPERYRLTLTLGGRPVMDGWWGRLSTADRKFRSLVGEYGSLDGAAVVLVDTEEGERVVAAGRSRASSGGPVCPQLTEHEYRA